MPPSDSSKKDTRVPKNEDFHVIDLKLLEVILGIAVLMTVAGLGYMAYSKIRLKAETEKLKALAEVVGSVAREVATFIVVDPDAPARPGSNGRAKSRQPKKQPKSTKSSK